MTTTIRDAVESEDHVSLSRQPGSTSEVRVEVKHAYLSPRSVVGVVSRAEFLAAVEAELGVLIINRDDLPEVVESADGHIQARGATLLNGTAAGSDALGWLAINEYLAANPPVDEAQVNALTTILSGMAVADEHTGQRDDRVLAEMLYRAGVRAPEGQDR